MSWWQYAILGAGGGAVAEVLEVFRCITAWRSDRRTPTGLLKSDPPGMRKYIDLPVLAILLPFRAILGAGAAMIFGLTGQISGAYAAIAFGFAAPVVLAQLGSVPAVAHAVAGDVPHDHGSAIPQDQPTGPRDPEPVTGGGAG
jgi:hypothetical protein